MESIWPDFLWMTDIHMDAIIKDKTRRKFLQSIRESQAKYIFITGDISICERHPKKKVPRLFHHLEMLSEAAGDRPVYFVLGNHDYWGTSIKDVREIMTRIHEKFPNMIWLSSQTPIMLDETALVGHDGWYDGRNGAGWNSRGALNDWNFIFEFIQEKAKSKNDMWKLMEDLSNSATEFVKRNLLESVNLGCRRIVILTHFPPWVESATDAGKIDPDYIAFYSSRSMGVEILEVARAHPEVEFLVLCGHAHTGQTHRPKKNVICLTGQAEYGQPAAQPPLQEILSKSAGLW